MELYFHSLSMPSWHGAQLKHTHTGTTKKTKIVNCTKCWYLTYVSLNMYNICDISQYGEYLMKYKEVNV
jgi:hypothetical protein